MMGRPRLTGSKPHISPSYAGWCCYTFEKGKTLVAGYGWTMERAYDRWKAEKERQQ